MKNPPGIYTDHKLIVDLIPERSKVLDLGCGQGELLSQLIQKKSVWGRGVDIDQDNIIQCVEKGLSVFQGNIDEGLADYQDKSFDYVILNRTIQVTHKPLGVIKEMLRVGKQGIVGFPNFANLRLFSYLFFKRRMPKSKILPFEWYNTPNIHLLTIKDFEVFCQEQKISITKRLFIRNNKIVSDKSIFARFPNYWVDDAVFVISAD